MPSAPASSASRASCGSSMLASSSTAIPSLVRASRPFSLRSCTRCSFCSRTRRWKSAISSALGLTTMTSASASMTSRSPSSITLRALSAPTRAGSPRLRARIAVCDVGPPSSVTNPARSTSARSFRCSMSAGARSRATRTIRSPGASLRGSAIVVGRPCASAASTRSTTWRTSVERSRRYSSSMAWNCRHTSSSWMVRAHSALISRVRIRSRGASASSASSRIMRWRSRKAATSDGAPAEMFDFRWSSSLRTALKPVVRRPIS